LIGRTASGGDLPGRRQSRSGSQVSGRGAAAAGEQPSRNELHAGKAAAREAAQRQGSSSGCGGPTDVGGRWRQQDETLQPLLHERIVMGAGRGDADNVSLFFFFPQHRVLQLRVAYCSNLDAMVGVRARTGSIARGEAREAGQNRPLTSFKQYT
jgi:hypothetical protein